MIGWDIGVLSVLKTFALMRSYIRYYTIKSGFSKKKHNPNKFNKRGRRKEWRNKLAQATDYSQFEQIEIQEPVPVTTDTADGGGKTRKDPAVKVNVQPPQDATHTSSPKTTAENSMKRAQSCLELKDKHTNPIPSQNTPTRSVSNKNLKEVLEQYEDIEKELGMTGYMIVNTTSRLREARLQASAASSVMKRKNRSPKNGITSISEHKLEDGGTDGDGDENENESQPSSPGSGSNPGTKMGESDTSATALKFLLSGVVKRNHLSVNDLLLQDARSVMECGRHQLSSNARDIILGYHEEVERCLEWISESPVSIGSGNSGNDNGNAAKSANNGNAAAMAAEKNENPNQPQSTTPPLSPALPPYLEYRDADTELSDRMNLIRKLKHNMGRTALMLSGGGAQAMYHLGTIKALCESNRYNDIGVISGTSGGSITAAMCAIRNQDELLRDVCVSTVSTDFGLDGEMKRKNIRWFPKLVDMGAYWLKHRLLVDSEDFKRCCEFYYKDITFEEAFKRTGKHVCITVSASRAESGGAQRLLLNHISTPHVTLASAVAASCALPGVMAPAKLRTKNSEGQQELFEVDGVEWIDGSVQADLPFKRISTLFNVSSYIVCQTNFHVVPFLHKAHHPNMKSLYWKIFQTCEWDIRSRALNLSRLGLFPKVFGHDISKVFKQKYHGDLTLVPRFTTLQVFGLKALVNPTVRDMEIYLQNGQSAAWPYLGVIQEMLRLENALDKCMSRLIEQRHELAPEDDEWDEIESITSANQSSRSRVLGSRREMELLKQKILSLELENTQLRKELKDNSGKMKNIFSSLTDKSQKGCW